MSSTGQGGGKRRIISSKDEASDCGVFIEGLGVLLGEREKEMETTTMGLGFRV